MNSVVYFPYIRVPNTLWFTKMLLYWDQVYCIVPYDHIGKRKLGENMLSLVEQQLVLQLSPAETIWNVPGFSKGFEGYLDSISTLLDYRRNNFDNGLFSRIHMEKIGSLNATLTEQNLAREADYPWYEVEVETASDFMFYLAQIIGLENEAIPITEDINELDRIVNSEKTGCINENQICSLRKTVLDNILPVPTNPLPASRIRHIKDCYGAELRYFRRRVENELIALANTDVRLRRRKMHLFVEEAHDEIRLISNELEKAGWRLVLDCISAMISNSIPQVGIVKAALDAVSERPKLRSGNDFLYAAHVSRLNK